MPGWRRSGGAPARNVLAACAASSTAVAQFVFAVTEGVTYQAAPKEIREKFEPLAEVIGTIAWLGL